MVRLLQINPIDSRISNFNSTLGRSKQIVSLAASIYLGELWPKQSEAGRSTLLASLMSGEGSGVYALSWPEIVLES